MANALISVRLSPQLVATLDRVADHLDCSPSRVVEILLPRSEAHRDKILKVPVGGSQSEKINLRLSAPAIDQLQKLTGYQEVREGEFTYAIAPSKYLRQMVAYFLSPEALRSAFPDAPNIVFQYQARPGDGKAARVPRASPVPRGAPPGSSWIGLLILAFLILLPFLVLWVSALVKWLRQRRMERRRKLAEDTGHGPGQSP